MLLWWLGCVAPVAFPTDAQQWTEVSLSAQGTARVQTETRRETHTPSGAPLGAEGVRRISTRVLRTVGEIHVGDAEPLRFDSSSPRAADPWVLRWQFAVGHVPAVVELDPSGRPRAIEAPEAWAASVAEAVAAVALPPGTDPVIQPEAFVADLTRTFPGQPPEGPWARSEPLASVEAIREEECARAGTRDGLPLWRCEGVCRAVREDGPQLFETDCWTEVWGGRDGLHGVETGYSGTRIWMEGGFVNDVAIAGQRLVVRSEDR